VDMPGYGYAAVGKEKVAAWTDLIHAYLRGRANLARVYVLIDARHGIKPIDAGVLDLLDKAAVSYQIVLTKADALSRAELDKRLAATAAALAKRAAAFPVILPTSSRTGDGMSELREAVARLMDERGALWGAEAARGEGGGGMSDRFFVFVGGLFGFWGVAAAAAAAHIAGSGTLATAASFLLVHAVLLVALPAA